jgi:hypothetical protein
VAEPVIGSSPLWAPLSVALNSPAALSESVEPEPTVVDCPEAAVPGPVDVPVDAPVDALELLLVPVCVPEVLDDDPLPPLVPVPLPPPPLVPVPLPPPPALGGFSVYAPPPELPCAAAPAGRASATSSNEIGMILRMVSPFRLLASRSSPTSYIRPASTVPQPRSDRQGTEPASKTQWSAASILAWLLPFALVLYLAIRGGGYDPVVRDEVGVTLWLALLIGGATMILPAGRVTRASWIALGLLAAFAGWTALSAIWSDSVERSLDSFVLVATYLGVFALAVWAQGRQPLQRMLGGVTAAIAIVAALALLSRLHPQWFPTNPVTDVLPNVKSRLNYPLNSWNGLAALLGMGLPLLLAAAVDSKVRVARALATATVPVVALAIFFTLSRGGAVAAAIGSAAFIALRSRRFEALPVLVLGAASSALAVGISAQFGALDDGASTSQAHQEGAIMAGILVVICAAVAWLRVRLDRAELERRLSGLAPRPRTTRRLLAAAAVVVLGLLVAAGATGRISSGWDDFKRVPRPSDAAARLQDQSGNGRYQYWQSTVDEMQTAPLQGTGAGTFEYWWARNGTIYGFTAYAHSLYFESLGETGIVGAALITALAIFIIVAGIRRCRSTVPRRRRGWLAGAVGSAVVFAIAMALDWGWHVPVIPVVFVLVAAALLQSDEADPLASDIDRTRRGRRSGKRWLGRRIAIACVALAILALTTASAIGAHLIEASQAHARANDLDAALDDARDAASFMPWAAAPHQQEALVLEEQQRYVAAAQEIEVAIRKEPTNWEPSYVLSRIYVGLGDLPAARRQYQTARALNPRSAIFLDHPHRKLP